ncbi:serine hydrolase [Sphaerisporangium sp. B11E5]|uniref:serine hydrolase domain-containing protein n=1 Tax=Sphaerisporangium sp. B11E5 TaxID=3153563 RepID=UPI00325E80A1
MEHPASPPHRRLAAAVVALLLAATGCTAPDPGARAGTPAARTAPSTPAARTTPSTAASPHPAPGSGYPGPAWARGDAREAGFDPRKLAGIAERARAMESNCLVVVRHGQIVADWYWNGAATSAHEVFSVTKSYTSTLVGIAQEEGLLDIDDPMARYIPRWRKTAAKDVRVRNVLGNDSGRHWDLTTDYSGLGRAADRTGFAIGLPQDAAPGKVWAYNNAAIQTLEAVLRQATGKDPADYARERLLGPLGMRHSEMTRDLSGNTTMYTGLRSTCEDLARFGLLFLRGGKWDGERLVPESWVRAATTRPSQDINAAYGYLWWINAEGTVAGPLRATTRQESERTSPSRLVPSAPPDMYWAIGLGGQIIQVDPSSDTVVVRLGSGDRRTGYGPEHTAEIVTGALTGGTS